MPATNSDGEKTKHRGADAGACTLFATHFTRLAELAAVYPNCKLWHFGVNAAAQSEQLDYTWKLQPGQQQAVHYGLTLANAVGIPQQVCLLGTPPPPPPTPPYTCLSLR